MMASHAPRTNWLGFAPLVPFEEATAGLPEGRLVEVSGQRVNVEIEGSGPPVLLLHGFAASTYSFRDLMPLLARDRKVIALDLNGFGYTERPDDPGAYAPAGQLRMIEEVLEALGISRCNVVGHSYGAALALLLAERRGARVDRAVLISPAAEFEEPRWFFRLPFAGRILYGLLRLMLSRPASFHKILARAFYRREKLTLEVSEEYRRRLLVEGLPMALRGFGKGMSRDHAPAFDFERITTPCLVMGGAHDAIVTPDACRRLAEALPRSHLVILKHSGHSGPEEEPHEVAAAIADFTGDAPW